MRKMLQFYRFLASSFLLVAILSMPTEISFGEVNPPGSTPSFTNLPPISRGYPSIPPTLTSGTETQVLSPSLVSPNSQTLSPPPPLVPSTLGDLDKRCACLYDNSDGEQYCRSSEWLNLTIEWSCSDIIVGSVLDHQNMVHFATGKLPTHAVIDLKTTHPDQISELDPCFGADIPCQEFIPDFSSSGSESSLADNSPNFPESHDGGNSL